ncbi:MAG: tetratricopeptide repeat protein [Alphaproteobacteria bacterium]|nr:tetratricopeptide repeat protein [Alphaproteobacteria bacterium]
MVFLALLAHAEVPLPDYQDALVQRTWYRVNSLIEAACSNGPGVMACAKEPLDEAIGLASTFQAQVVQDARLEYLLGLAYLSRGDRSEGETHLRIAVRLDPERSDAWHDLGEILLQDSRFDEAAEAFAHVTELVDTGPKSWLGPWREAEVAAHQGRPEAFEKHMKLALQRGFSFRTIRGLPNWRQFYADPVMGPSVTKLVTVYGTPDILKSLEPEEAP